MNRGMTFSEENYHRIMTNISIQKKRLLRPAFVLAHNSENYCEANGIKKFNDDSDVFLLSEQDCKDLYNTINELEGLCAMLEWNFYEQFKHNPKARRVCPNEKCKNIYAYFYEDWKYCPKCGAMLDASSSRL